jgi:flavin reductase (DIM6/NTAB) family NADH-FMN oxidoreductase RutF
VSGDISALDDIIRSLDPPLIVVTTAAGGERAGCLVGFHAQSSIDPRRYSVWLSKANHTYRVGLRSTHLAVQFLRSDQLALAELFGTQTGDEIDKFADLDVRDGPGGVPLLACCRNRFAGRLTALLDERGDHVCVAVEPETVFADVPFQPLRLSAAAHLQPGHGNEERNNPPTERAVGR